MPELKPLPAHLRHALRRVRRDESGIRQPGLPLPADFDEIVAVGAIAVQEHDEAFGRLSARRLKSWAIKFMGHRVHRPLAAPFSFCAFCFFVTAGHVACTGAPSRRFTT